MEPGYSGPLSCYFVNISNHPISLKRDEEIAKLCFHKLSNTIGSPVSETISEQDYVTSLATHAAQYPHSFLDIGGMEQRLVERVKSSVGPTLYMVTGVILILTVIATIQPLFGKFFGIDTTKEEIIKLQASVDQAKEQVGSSQLLEKQKEINSRLDKVEQLLKKLVR